MSKRMEKRKIGKGQQTLLKPQGQLCVRRVSKQTSKQPQKQPFCNDKTFYELQLYFKMHFVV